MLQGHTTGRENRGRGWEAGTGAAAPGFAGVTALISDAVLLRGVTAQSPVCCELVGVEVLMPSPTDFSRD